MFFLRRCECTPTYTGSTPGGEDSHRHGERTPTHTGRAPARIGGEDKPPNWLAWQPCGTRPAGRGGHCQADPLPTWVKHRLIPERFNPPADTQPAASTSPIPVRDLKLSCPHATRHNHSTQTQSTTTPRPPACPAPFGFFHPPPPPGTPPRAVDAVRISRYPPPAHTRPATGELPGCYESYPDCYESEHLPVHTQPTTGSKVDPTISPRHLSAPRPLPSCPDIYHRERILS